MVCQVQLEDHYTRTSIIETDLSQYKKKSKRPEPIIDPHATAASITSWLNKWRNPPVPSKDKRRVEFITIKADASLFDFDKGDGSFTGKTTVDQLKALEEKIVALVKAEEAHVLMLSKLPDIAKRYEKSKLSAMDAASKKKTKK